MTTRRKGMGKGKGRGYKNIIGQDPRVHSDSARGRKQPQKMSYMELKRAGYDLKPTWDDDKDGIANSLDCKPLDPNKHKDMPVTEIGEFEESLWADKKVAKKGKNIGSAIVGAGKTVKSAISGGIKKYRELKEKQKEEALIGARHPKALELKQQKARVDELRKQIAAEPDSEESEKLEKELNTEEQQLRSVQEDISNIKIPQFSDRELKEFAVRFEPGIFGHNPYEKELIRRIEARKKLDAELTAAKNKPVKKGIFEDLF